MQKTQLLLILAFLAVTSRSIAALPAAISKTRSVAELEKLEEKPATYVMEGVTIADYEKVTGKKLSFWQRLVFKMGKKRLPKNYFSTEAQPNFNIWGFLLGLAYGPIGLGAAYLISSKSNVRASAWLGFKIWIAILLVMLLVVFAIAGGKFK